MKRELSLAVMSAPGGTIPTSAYMGQRHNPPRQLLPYAMRPVKPPERGSHLRRFRHALMASRSMP